MITRKFYTDIPLETLPYIRQFNSVLRTGYNRLCENMSLSDAETYIKENMQNVDLMDASFIKLAVNKAKSLVTKEKIVVFGGYKNLQKRAKNKITKEQWAALRSPGILLRGSAADNSGNRKAKLDIANNRIIFKPSRNTEIFIKLPNVSNKTRKDLLVLQRKCELHEACFSLEITRNSINIIYDECLVKENYKQVVALDNRVLAIDQNPNYIGLVVLDGTSIIYKEIIDLTDSNKVSSTNKRKHFIIEASKHIAELARHYRCNLVIEDLNIKSKNHGKGKKFNQSVNNLWNRNLLINNLKKRSNLLGIKCVEICCAYTSFVGQMTNTTEYDSVAAAIEIGYRGQLKLIKKKYEILPKTLDLSQLSNRWKDEVIANGINSWLEFYNFLKKTETSYRFLFIRDKFKGNSFNLLSCNSCIYVHKIT